LRRTLFMQVFGLALNVHPLRIPGLLKAHRAFNTCGYASWDALAKHEVLQEETGILHTAAAYLILIGHGLLFFMV